MDSLQFYDTAIQLSVVRCIAILKEKRYDIYNAEHK